MARKTRIRFDTPHGKWIVESKHWYLFIPIWHRAKKKGYYKSDAHEVRYFDSYDSARVFAVRMATDVVMEHKSNEYKPLL